MSIDLGVLGAHLRAHEASPENVAEIERAGYGTLWLDASPPEDLAQAEELLAATTRIIVGTAVVNIWTTKPETVAASYQRITARYPDRFLLGVGVGHREVDADYASPYDSLVAYLDRLSMAGVPASRVVLAALGPRMLRLALDRAAGTVPVMVTLEHTRRAREILGPGKLLLPGLFAVLDDDAERARAAVRSSPAANALRISNYAANLRRLGFTDDDLSGPGSDRIIDALALHGDAVTIAAGIIAHLDAGADHVGITPLGGDPARTFQAIADAVASARSSR